MLLRMKRRDLVEVEAYTVICPLQKVLVQEQGEARKGLRKQQGYKQKDLFLY
jgi:hypothetical protein